MDIYRFFHPHHNPRLRRSKLRQLELSELEQAASELKKAIIAAQARTERNPVPPIMSEHFTDIIKAMNFVEQSLQTLCDAHPGDDRAALQELVDERSQSSGWEQWVVLTRQQLGLEKSVTSFAASRLEEDSSSEAISQ